MYLSLQVSELISSRRRFVRLQVIPYVIYHFQVVAREERGLGRVTYNRSPVVTFQTSRDGGGPAISRQYFARYDDGDEAASADYLEEAAEAAEAIWQQAVPPAAHGESPVVVLGMAIEVFVLVAVLIAVTALIMLGMLYRMARAYCIPLLCYNNNDDDDEDEDEEDGGGEDNDDNEEEEEDDVEKTLSVVGEEEEEEEEEDLSQNTKLV